jgi:hypothetical protein
MVEKPKRLLAGPASTLSSDPRPTIALALRGLRLAGLALLLGWGMGARQPVAAGPPAPLLRLASTLTLQAPVAAVAINADESLIAAATTGSGDTTTIVITDRRSKRTLGEIAASVGEKPRLRFSPVEDLLLVAGSEALQLWEVPIAPLKPGKPLPEAHLRWSVPVEGGAPVGGMAFGRAPAAVIWSAGGALYRRPTAAGGAFSGKPGWERQGGAKAPVRFVAGMGAGRLVVFGGGKTLALLDARSFADQGELKGHRFPVVSAAFSPSGALVSLDAGYNLVRWKQGGRAEFTGYPSIPEGSPAPAGLLAIAGAHYLILPAEGNTRGGLIVDVAGSAVKGTLPLAAGSHVAVSPTGRYILATAGSEVRLYAFAAPMAVRDYVNRLKSLGALATARNFVNLLDPRRLPEKAKAELLAQLEQEPAALALDDLLTSLAAAEEEGDLDGMVYWAEKALAIDPNHPQARGALARVTEIRETRLLTSARRALEAGEPRQAIVMLSEGIPSRSPRYGEALRTIREAEGARGVQTALEQAREKMNLANYEAAKAIVSEVLRKDSGNAAALALREEISDRAGGFRFEPLTMLFLAVLGMALLGGVLFVFRNLLAPFLRRASLQETGPLRQRSGQARGSARPEAARAGRPRTPPRDRGIPPRPDRAQRELRRAVEALFEKTEEMIRLSRQRDVQQQHTSFLLELEAELTALHRRMMDRTADPAAARARLETIARQLGKLKFAQPKAAEARGATANYYDILRLRHDASPEEIKTAYHKMLKEYHPDLHSQSSFGWVRAEAEKMSRKISEAYEVLSDVSKRERYNRTLQKKGGFPG